MIKHGTGRRLRLTAGAAVLLLALTACATGGGEPQQPDPSTSEAAPTAAAETTAPAETEAPSAEELGFIRKDIDPNRILLKV